MNKDNKKTASVNVFDLLAVIIFCAVIFIGGITTVLLPDRDFSESENTTLTTHEDLFSGNALKKLFSGEMSDLAGKYFRHQFPLRDKMLELRALADMLLVRYETGGVIYGADGYLIPREDNAGDNYVNGNVAAVNSLSAALEKQGVDTLFALAPRPCDVLWDYYPSAYSSKPLEKVRSLILDNSEALDLAPVMRAAADKGEYVYYKTDHHWTTYGAYLAYCEIMNAYGIAPKAVSEFEREVASDAFYGTSHSSVMSPLAEADTVEFFHYKNAEYMTEIANGPSFEGFYDRSFLDKKDKYSAFLGGNFGLLRVTEKGSEGREKLLVVKDSYANSVIPFLAIHYDLVVVDPRYYRESVYALAIEEEVSKLLVLCGTDGITDANTYLVLNFGIPQE